jgi:hypothetical protein
VGQGEVGGEAQTGAHTSAQKDGQDQPHAYRRLRRRDAFGVE